MPAGNAANPTTNDLSFQPTPQRAPRSTNPLQEVCTDNVGPFWLEQQGALARAAAAAAAKSTSGSRSASPGHEQQQQQSELPAAKQHDTIFSTISATAQLPTAHPVLQQQQTLPPSLARWEPNSSLSLQPEAADVPSAADTEVPQIASAKRSPDPLYAQQIKQQTKHKCQLCQHIKQACAPLLDGLDIDQWLNISRMQLPCGCSVPSKVPASSKPRPGAPSRADLFGFNQQQLGAAAAAALAAAAEFSEMVKSIFGTQASTSPSKSTAVSRVIDQDQQPQQGELPTDKQSSSTSSTILSTVQPPADAAPVASSRFSSPAAAWQVGTSHSSPHHRLAG
jgi:hypothetical protein